MVADWGEIAEADCCKGCEAEVPHFRKRIEVPFIREKAVAIVNVKCVLASIHIDQMVFCFPIQGMVVSDKVFADDKPENTQKVRQRKNDQNKLQNLVGMHQVDDSHRGIWDVFQVFDVFFQLFLVVRVDNILKLLYIKQLR